MASPCCLGFSQLGAGFQVSIPSKYTKRVQWQLYFPFLPLEVMQHHFSHIQLITINSFSPVQIQEEGNYPLPLVGVWQGHIAEQYVRWGLV